MLLYYIVIQSMQMRKLILNYTKYDYYGIMIPVGDELATVTIHRDDSNTRPIADFDFLKENSEIREDIIVINEAVPIWELT